MTETPDAAFPVGAFGAWIGNRLGAQVQIGAARRTSQGFSNETWVVDTQYETGQRTVVVRIAPQGDALFPDTSVDSQVKVLDALSTIGDVAVPKVLWHEAAPEVFGREFYVMDHVAGRIPSDTYLFEGWIQDLAPEAQAQVQRSMLATMAAIHRLDWRSGGLGFLPRIGLDQQFAYWGAYLDWAQIEVPSLQAAYEWSVAHRPLAEPEPSLVWGDARLGNLIFADDLSVRAVLDWEMASIGPGELDLGWHLLLERVAMGFGGRVGGFVARDAAVDAYERYLGRPVTDLNWYEVWAGVRAAATNLRRVRLQSGLEPSSDPVLDTISEMMN